jgi:hypothetical protein
VARANGYTGDMRELPRPVAFKILFKQFVIAPKFDLVAKLSQAIAAELVDTYVNMGAGNRDSKDGPIFWLQRWLNAFNQQGMLYKDITVDGNLGNGTLAALKAYLATRSESAMVKALECSQGARYLRIIEANPKQESFAYGWIDKRIEFNPAGELRAAKRETLSLFSTAMEAPPMQPLDEFRTKPMLKVVEPVLPPAETEQPVDEVERPTLSSFVGKWVAGWVKSRFKERTTLYGMIMLVASLANDPMVFASITEITTASGEGRTKIIAAIASLVLIVVKDRKK